MYNVTDKGPQFNIRIIVSFNQHPAGNFSSGEAKQFYIYCNVNNKLFDIYLTTEVKDSK